jgi:hypothetical protein
MQSLRRWCAAHGKGVSLRVVKVAVKGESYGLRATSSSWLSFCNVIFRLGRN